MPIKLAYVGLKWNYGNRSEGYSYEYRNLEAGLKSCVEQGLFECQYFHPDEPGEIDKLANHVNNSGPDAILHAEFNESLDLPEAIALKAIAQHIRVICWSSDASWRFQNWILPRKHRYTHFITTHSSTLEWYHAHGMKVIKSQWGGSPLYTPDFSGDKRWDITFVGQKHGIRPEIVHTLNDAGIKVHLWGQYWEGFQNWHGYASFEEMLDIFRYSKISLNLSNPWHIGTLPQIKGRHFEIPKCGGFQLSTPADNLTEYFIGDKEIVIANNMKELIDQCHHYLNHDVDRERIAKAGWERVQMEHTWEHRLTNILKDLS